MMPRAGSKPALLFLERDVGPRVADEPVAIRHLDLRQRRLVQHILLADDAVEEQHVGGGGVNIVGGQTAGVSIPASPVGVSRIGSLQTQGVAAVKNKSRS